MLLDKAEEMNCSHVFVMFPSDCADRGSLKKKSILLDVYNRIKRNCCLIKLIVA